MCMDYQALNNITMKDILVIDELLDKLGGAQDFITPDL